MKNYNHIVWDWNGTLFNDVTLCVDIINEMLKKRNLKQLNLNDYKEKFDFPVKDYYKKVGFDYSIESFELVGTEFIDIYNKRRYECDLHTKVKDIIVELSNLGIKQYVLSARQQSHLIEELKHYKIYDYFEEIIGLNNHYAEGKIENAKAFINSNKINPNTILLIGDTTHDFEVAKTIGINCALISNGHQVNYKLVNTGTKIYNELIDAFNYLGIDEY